MKEFWTEVTLRDDEDGKRIIKAFFQDFNPQNSILIKGNKAENHFFSNEQLPQSIVEAIESCQNIGDVDKTRKWRVKKSKSEMYKDGVLKLEILVRKSSSFKHFIILLEECLEIENTLKIKEFFEKLVTISTEVDEVTWKNLTEELECKKVRYKERDKARFGEIILKRFYMTPIPFLKLMKEYRERYFR